MTLKESFLSSPLSGLGQKKGVVDQTQHIRLLKVSPSRLASQSVAELTEADAIRLRALANEELEVYGDTELCLEGFGLCPSMEAPVSSGKELSIRARLHRLLESPIWHLIIMSVVLVDATCASMEVAMAIAVNHGAGDSGAMRLSEKLDLVGNLISNVFVLETLLHLWTGGLSIFKSKLQVCDFTVVWITFLLRLIVNREHAAIDRGDLIQFLLLVRLWRIISIVDAVALAATMSAKEKFRQERTELHKVIRLWQERYLQEKEKKLIAIKLALNPITTTTTIMNPNDGS